MQPNVEFLFDFGSPNAYLAAKTIPGIENRTGARFAYVPVLLGGIFKLTNNASPAQSNKGIKNKLEYAHRETERFLKRHAITTYRFNPHFPVITLLLMRGAVAAQCEGVFDQFVTAAFHHMWEEPKKMDDPVVLRDALTASGLDADALIARSQTAEVKTKLAENTQRAVDRGAFGAPTCFVGDEMFFGKDQMRDVEEEIVAQKARA